MRRTLIVVVALAGTVAPSVFARQTPPGMQRPPTEAPEILDPNPKKDHGCFRPDAAKSSAAIRAALAEPRKPGEAPPEVTEAQKQVAGCTYYKVSLTSKMTIEDTEVPGVTSSISGQGSITFGLAPDNAEAGYDFTSAVQDLSAPVYWGPAQITRPNCEVNVAELPYTMFSFWLGITRAPVAKVGVRITPDGNELHSTAGRCQDQFGKWHPLPPAKEAIFTPAWIKLHGEGAVKVAPSADQQKLSNFTNDLAKAGPKAGDRIKPNTAYQTPAIPNVSSPTGAMDLGKLQAMQDFMARNPNATPAEMMEQMNGVMPGLNLDGHLAAAEDNFMFKAPGECRADESLSTTVCDLGTRTVTLKDRTGYGTIKRITETTVITITKLPPRP